MTILIIGQLLQSGFFVGFPEESIGSFGFFRFCDVPQIIEKVLGYGVSQLFKNPSCCRTMAVEGLWK